MVLSEARDALPLSYGAEGAGGSRTRDLRVPDKPLSSAQWMRPFSTVRACSCAKEGAVHFDHGALRPRRDSNPHLPHGKGNLRTPARTGCPSQESEDPGRGAFLSLDADELTQPVDDVDEIRLRRHHGLDILVGAGCLIDDAGVLAAFHMGGRQDVVLKGKPTAGLGA